MSGISLGSQTYALRHRPLQAQRCTAACCAVLLSLFWLFIAIFFLLALCFSSFAHLVSSCYFFPPLFKLVKMPFLVFATTTSKNTSCNFAQTIKWTYSTLRRGMFVWFDTGCETKWRRKQAWDVGTQKDHHPCQGNTHRPVPAICNTVCHTISSFLWQPHWQYLRYLFSQINYTN